jgi:hypothetical protein
MRRALKVILQRHSQSYRHDYTQTWQVLDIDLTGMPAGRLGEGVTPGYFAKQKNHRGRQLGRVLATVYDEIVVDRLYDGKRVLHRSLQELLTTAEDVLDLAENKRESTIIRLDAGGGEEADINWVLERGYALLVKVKNWRRAHKLAATVSEWHSDPKVPERDVGWVPSRPVSWQYGIARRTGSGVIMCWSSISPTRCSSPWRSGRSPKAFSRWTCC